MGCASFWAGDGLHTSALVYVNLLPIGALCQHVGGCWPVVRGGTPWCVKEGKLALACIALSDLGVFIILLA
jgi:hypothetical protein